MIERDSTLINTIRFPLACLVVFLHSYVAVDGYKIHETWERAQTGALTGTDWYSLTCITFSHVLTQVAVPMFFFISGYLFYVGLKEWNWQKYGEKMKRRVGSLIVPYLSWNSIMAAIALGIMVSGTLLLGKPIERIGNWFHEVGGVFGIYWSDQSHLASSVNLLGHTTHNSYPILMPMWFIRNLIVVVVLAPVLWYLLKKNSVVMLMLLGLGWALKIDTNIPGLGFASLFMFGWGGHFSLSGKSITEQFGRISNRLLTPLFVIGFLMSICFDGRMTQIGQITLSVWILTAMPMIIKWFMWLIDRKPLISERMKKLSDSSFTIFAFHGIIISYVWSVLWKIIGIEHSGILLTPSYVDNHPVACIFCYLLIPIVATAICVVFYMLIKKIPMLNKLLNGR